MAWKLDPESSEWVQVPDGTYNSVATPPTTSAGPDYTLNGQGYYYQNWDPSQGDWLPQYGPNPIQLPNGKYAIPAEQQMMLAKLNTGDFVTNFLDKANLPLLLGTAFTGGAIGAAFDPYSLEAGGATGAAGATDAAWGVNQQFLDPWDLQYDPTIMYQNPELYTTAASGLPEFTPPTGQPNTSGADYYKLAQSGAAGGAGTAISRILSGNGMAADYISALGTIAPGVLAAFGANAQGGAYRAVANQYLGLGAPYRGLLEASYKPGFSLANEPGYQQALDASTNAFLRSSAAGRAPGVSSGNPFDNPGAWAETMKYVTGNTALPYLQNYRNTLAGAGQLGVSASAPAALGGAQSQGGVYDALGYGLGNLLNPQPNYLQDFSKVLRNMYNLNTNRTGLV